MNIDCKNTFTTKLIIQYYGLMRCLEMNEVMEHVHKSRKY